MKTTNKSGVRREGVLVPEGVYKGRWHGYVVSFIYQDWLHSFESENGIKGDAPVTITVKGFEGKIKIEVETE